VLDDMHGGAVAKSARSRLVVLVVMKVR
jgi:hypothetical protein